MEQFRAVKVSDVLDSFEEPETPGRREEAWVRGTDPDLPRPFPKEGFTVRGVACSMLRRQLTVLSNALTAACRRFGNAREFPIRNCPLFSTAT